MVGMLSIGEREAIGALFPPTYLRIESDLRISFRKRVPCRLVSDTPTDRALNPQ